MITKKDLEVIADAIFALRDKYDYSRLTLIHISTEISNAIVTNDLNPRFDSGKFIKRAIGDK
jgi:hypothetical protein